MRRIRLSIYAGSLLAFAMEFSGPLAAGPALALKRVGSGFNRPLFVTAPPGDTNRLFVVEQHTGRLRILDLSTLTTGTNAFLRITGLTSGNEQGLLGLAFHPNYASNGFFYVNYTTTGGGAAGHSEVTRFQAVGDPRTATVADPSSKTVLLMFNQPEENHNGGWLSFGLDGFLYISTGDGGGANDQHGTIGNGQNRNSLLGKILRIDVDQGATYGIPDGNPFKGDTTKKQEIWAFGLRNPWRCSIDRVTGDLWIGDVGQDTREEIDVDPAGAGGLNFGWRPREGFIQNSVYPSETPVTPATNPIHDYTHAFGVAVIGGYVYRGSAIPGLQGVYFFADYGSARFWTLQYNGTTKTNFQERTAELNSGSPKPVGNVSSFGEDAAGELYVCDISDGEIYKVVAAAMSISNVRFSSNQISFQFTSVPGQGYSVDATESLVPPNWQSLTNLIGSSTSANVLITNSPSGRIRFYRVRATP